MKKYSGVRKSPPYQPLHIMFPTAPPSGKRQQAQKRMVNAAALMLIGMTFCFLSACRAALTVVTQGGEQQLRQAVPPATPGPRVLIFAIDGTNYNKLIH